MRVLRLRYVAATTPWGPLGIASALSVLIVAWPARDPSVALLEAIAIFLTGAGGFAFDDPAAVILAASPTSMLHRRLLRLLVVGPPVVLLWSILVTVQGTAGARETWALLAMFGGLAAMSLATAGIAARRVVRGGPYVAPTVLILLFLSTLFPARLRPLPMGDIPGGLPQITLRWSIVAAIGALVFLASSRDLARMAPQSWRRRLLMLRTPPRDSRWGSRKARA
jgi:hypothetical protein